MKANGEICLLKIHIWVDVRSEDTVASLKRWVASSLWAGFYINGTVRARNERWAKLKLTRQTTRMTMRVYLLLKWPKGRWICKQKRNLLLIPTLDKRSQVPRVERGPQQPIFINEILKIKARKINSAVDFKN